MKKLIELKLKLFAILILAKYKPEVIGVTGSVGKTSTKEAIYCVLKKKYKVRRSVKNYNNEIGLPLTIIGTDSPGRNIVGWFLVFFKALRLILVKDKSYPQILILEMGIDKPGDMGYLTRIVQPHIGVLTYIGDVHLEFFKSRHHLIKEKSQLIKNLPKNGWSIINYDNKDSRRAKDLSQARVLLYGLEEGSDIRAQEIRFSYNELKSAEGIKGISFKLSYQGSFTPVLLPQALGIGTVYAALAAAAVGAAKGMNLVEIGQALREFESPRGRMKVISGIKRTIIIDDSYNAEPASVRAALGALKQITVREGARKLVILGDMLELGNSSEPAHRDLGRYVAKCGFDGLIVVGERSRDIARGAKEAGMEEEQVFNFADSPTAGRFIQDRIKPGDLILVKGSQGVRMEKIVKELMTDPLRAKELLVRQDKEWQDT